ncbi:MAG: pyruvate kinase [Chlorobium sp.]|nr:MAG: pyruvate kinase [Chlorobium sp.]
MAVPGKKDQAACSTSLETEVLIEELSAIRKEIVSIASEINLEKIHDNYSASARNLLHYLGLRRHDHRVLQMRLASMGLSSLGRAESHVLATLEGVLRILKKLQQQSFSAEENAEAVDLINGQKLLVRHTESVLGPAPAGRNVRIMVTMPTEAACDYTLVHDLVMAGMDCMRINCAHDDATLWLKMIEHLRAAEHAVGRSCRIAIDIAGPKLRTGPVEPGPTVMRIRPSRDVYGRVTSPACIWLTHDLETGSPKFHVDATLPVSRCWLSYLRQGDRVRFIDARNAKREFDIIEVFDDGCLCEMIKTAYLVPGTLLYREDDGNEQETIVGDFPASVNSIFLKEGDFLFLTKDCKPGKPAVYDEKGQLLSHAMIGCTIPGALDNVRPAEQVWFDDGKIGGLIEKNEDNHVLVSITHTPPGGGKLLADKGMNFPDSDLMLGALTSKDLEDIVFAARYADVVELSFANTASDVLMLQRYLKEQGDRCPAIVLKIETKKGFDNLPNMLLAAMQWPSCGVMIARGDLAVECGYERMAEVQEEILWICEAAHVPVIWATQVLETMAKQGIPSRAEITDAAMGERAECVMLNKGPHVVSAVRTLDDILRRMQSHVSKKCAMLRELHLAHNLLQISSPKT